MLQFFDKNDVDITEEVYIDKCSNPSCLGESWCSAWGHCQEEETNSNHTLLLDEPLFENGCGNEQEIDIALSQQLASTEEVVPYSAENQDPNMPKVNIHFANPTTKEDLATARISSVPKKAQDDMAYCMRIWDQWKAYRLELVVSTENILITTLSKSSLDEEMSHFVLEVRKKEYPPTHYTTLSMESCDTCKTMGSLIFQGKHVCKFSDDTRCQNEKITREGVRIQAKTRQNRYQMKMKRS